MNAYLALVRPLAATLEARGASGALDDLLEGHRRLLVALVVAHGGTLRVPYGALATVPDGADVAVRFDPIRDDLVLTVVAPD